MEKSIWQNSTFIHDKTLNKVGIEGMYLTVIKAVYEESIADIILKSKKPKAFPVNSKQDKMTLLLLLSIILKV